MQTYADLNGSIVIEEAAPLPPPFQELPDDSLECSPEDSWEGCSAPWR